jgi:hypothetical protein
VPDTPQTIPAIAKELRTLWEELQVNDKLSGWVSAAKYLGGHVHKKDEDYSLSGKYLVELDTHAKTTSVTYFPPDYLDEAVSQYEIIEMVNAETRRTHGIVKYAVLISVQSVDMLEMAYPNYYGDTKSFIMDIWSALNENEQ